MFILPVVLNQFDPWCLQVEQAFDVSHFSLRRIPTLPLAVRLHMCLTAGDELCFQRGNDGRKGRGGGMYCLCLLFFFFFSFHFCVLLLFSFYAPCFLQPVGSYTHTERFVKIAFSCSQNSI